MKTPPSHDALKSHFSKAKEIRCLNLGTPVGVCHAGPLTYNAEDNSWHAGLVVFWRNGELATITKTKDAGGCKGCGEHKLKIKYEPTTR